jgi:hypothetical protein
MVIPNHLNVPAECSRNLFSVCVCVCVCVCVYVCVCKMYGCGSLHLLFNPYMIHDNILYT